MPTNPDASIIRATLSDLDLAAPLFDAYRQFYEQPADAAGARAFVEQRLTQGDSVIFVAVSGTGGDRTGQGFCQLYPSFSSVSMRRLWIFNDLYVAPEARGSGVGAALLRHAQAFAKETGAKGLSLQTASDNLTAQRLYEAMGWQRETRFVGYTLLV